MAPTPTARAVLPADALLLGVRDDDDDDDFLHRPVVARCIVVGETGETGERGERRGGVSKQLDGWVGGRVGGWADGWVSTGWRLRQERPFWIFGDTTFAELQKEGMQLQLPPSLPGIKLTKPLGFLRKA